MGKPKLSMSADKAADMLGDPRKLRGLSKKEIKDLSDLAAGKVRKGGDIAAGIGDFFGGRKSNRTSTPPPPVRHTKGASGSIFRGNRNGHS